jgi:antitoxin VapB
LSEARFFNNGGSQAVRLPKDCRFDPDKKAIIRKIGDMVLIVPEEKIAPLLIEAYGAAGEDFFPEGRDEMLLDNRDAL